MAMYFASVAPNYWYWTAFLLCIKVLGLWNKTLLELCI